MHRSGEYIDYNNYAIACMNACLEAIFNIVNNNSFDYTDFMSGKYSDYTDYVISRMNTHLQTIMNVEKNNSVDYTNDCVKTIEDYMIIDTDYKYNFDFLYNKGLCYFYSQQFSEAINCFDTAISLEKKSMAFYNRALCKLKLKDISSALQDFKTATQDQEILNLPNVQEYRIFIDKFYGDI